MQKLKNDLLKYLGDPIMVDTAMSVIREHLCTIKCEVLCTDNDFSYKYGNDHYKQEADSYLERETIIKLAEELLEQGILEFSEEYSPIYQGIVKSTSINVIKDDRVSSKDFLIRSKF